VLKKPFDIYESEGQAWSFPMRLFLIGFAVSGCAATGVQVTQTGTVQCFEETQADSKPPTCELSAAAKIGNAIVFANDKPIPGDAYSPMLAFPIEGDSLSAGAKPAYLKDRPFREGMKYEGLTVTPDGQYALAITGFDRYSKDKPEQDRYNTLLAWPVSAPDRVAVVEPQTRQDVTSSVPLREKLLTALSAVQANEIGYFKIEGLAAIPGNKLLFGVREIGTSYKDWHYSIQIIESEYSIDNGVFRLQGEPKPVYQYSPPPQPGIAHKLGLSSVEYDPAHERLYLLTSFEEGENPEPKDIGAYLWVLPLEDMRANKPPTLIKQADGKPLMLSHKAEGLAVLDKSHVLIIYDDDRVITQVQDNVTKQARDRRLNESAFGILQLD
jgi:hypothetical protein